MQNVPTEYDEQVTFVEWLDLKKISYFHVPNSTWTKSIQVKLKNKRLGVKAGVPDLFLFLPKKTNLVIEMKRTRGSATSQEQKEWLKLLEVQGFKVAVCKGFESAKKFVERFL